MSTDDLATWAYFQGIFILTCLSLSVLITVAWFKTGGSVLPAILIHGGTNVWSKAVGAPMFEVTGTDVRTWIVFAAAIVVVVVTRGRLGAVDHRDGGSELGDPLDQEPEGDGGPGSPEADHGIGG